MARVVAEQTKIEMIQELVKVNESLVRQLNTERNLVHETAVLVLRLERTVRKSNARRRAIKQLEVALLRERAKEESK